MERFGSMECPMECPGVSRKRKRSREVNSIVLLEGENDNNVEMTSASDGLKMSTAWQTPEEPMKTDCARTNPGNYAVGGKLKTEELTRTLSNRYSSLFFRCRTCVINIPCEHSKETLFKACQAFKTELQIIPCPLYSEEIHGMKQSTLPSYLSDTFSAFEVAPDGNCFYSAVSVCLTKHPGLGKYLRQAAGIEYFMNSNISQLLNYRGIPPQEVLAKTNDGVWADSTAIFIVSSVISKRIEVMELTGQGIYNCYYDANPYGSRESIHLFLNNHHFYPLVPKSMNTKLPAASYTPPPYQQKNDISAELLESDIVCWSKPDGKDVELQVRYLSQQPQLQVKAKMLSMMTDVLTETATCEKYKETCSKYKIDLVNEKYLRSIREFGFNRRKHLTSTSNFYGHAANEALKEKAEIHMETELNEIHINSETQNATTSISNQNKNPETKRGKDGKYVKGVYVRFQNCLMWVVSDLQYLQKNNSKSTLEKEINDYVVQCAQSRVPWNERVAPETNLTKLQAIRREKVSKNVYYALLTSSEYQKRFCDALHQIGLGSYSDIFLSKLNSQLSKYPSKRKSCTTQAKPTSNPLNVDKEILSVENCEHQSRADGHDLENLSDDDVNTDEQFVGRRAIADLLNIDVLDLEYTPPSAFELVIQPDQLSRMFDFQTGTFNNRKWATEISQVLAKVQGACSFKALKEPTYFKRRGKGFAIIKGKCGCGVYFDGHVNSKPVIGETMTVSFTTKGSFNLLQDKFTGRPVSGNERAQIAEKLQHVKADAVFLRNVNHLPALRLLHGNYSQASSEVLRKIKSQKKLESRLHIDPAQDILLQKAEYAEASHPKASVRGYIQYSNTNPGNFKIILYDQGALSLHADQASKSGTVCYLDSTGGIISDINGREVLLYRLLGSRKTNCTYNIAEMLSEKGTIVELTDFLKRVKYDVLKVRPSFKNAMAEMIVVDWSWPLLHSAANAWNTETIQDYLYRSYSVLSDFNIEWGKKSCIFICTSHLIHATFRNLSKRIHSVKEKKIVMPYALASIARLQECFSLEELKCITRDVTRLFAQQYLNCDVLDELCKRLTTHKTKVEKIMKDADERIKETENDEDALTLAKSKSQKLLREQSPFYHIFKKEREKQMQIIEENATCKNQYYCPTVLDVFEKDKMAMFPFWAAAIPRKVTNKADFLRETNSTVESSFHRLKNLHGQGSRVCYSDFVRRRYEMHCGKNKDTLTKLVKLQMSETVSEKPTQLIPEKWKKKRKKTASHFSPKIDCNLRIKNLKQANIRNSNKDGDGVTTDPTSKLNSNSQNLSESATLNVIYPLHGFANIGNTCYLSAALQLMSSMSEINDLTDVSSQAHHLFNFIQRKVRTDTSTGVSPKDVAKIQEHVSNMFIESGVKETYQQGLQHDATEFYRSILNLPEMGKMKDQFAVTLVNNYMCSSCGYGKEILDVTCGIDIDISKGFVAGIEGFLNKPETSECSECQQKTLSNKVKLANVPLLFMVTTNLLAGNLDGTGNFVMQKKSNDYIVRSLTINDVPYILHGVICHRGAQTNSGHYVTYLNKGNIFVCCDDMTVYETHNVIGDVYMYVFRKVTTHLSEL